MTQGQGQEQPMSETGAATVASSSAAATASSAVAVKSPWQQPKPFATLAHGGGGVEVVPRRAKTRSAPSPRSSWSSSPRRPRDDTAFLSGEPPSKEDHVWPENIRAHLCHELSDYRSNLMLHALVESSNRKFYQQQQQQQDQNQRTANNKATVESSPSSSPPPPPRNKATVFVGSTVAAAEKQQQTQQRQGTPRNRTSAAKKKQKQQRAGPTTTTTAITTTTTTTTAGKKKQKKPWLLRLFLGCKSVASRQVVTQSAHSRNNNDARRNSSSSSKSRIVVETTNTKTSISPKASWQSSSQPPLLSPVEMKKNTGTSMTTTTTTTSPRRSLAGNSSTASLSSSAAAQQPPTIRRSRSGTRSSTQSTSHVSKRSSHSDENEPKDLHESIVEALARRLEEMEKLETATTVAAESSAATSSSGDGLNNHHQHYSTSSQTAGNSQAVTQPIDNRQNAQKHHRNYSMIPPAAVVKTAVLSPSAVSSLAHEQSSSASPLRLLSTVEENLDEILSIPSSWSRPPPVEVTLNPNHHQQNLRLSLSTSSEESEAEHESNDDEAAVAHKEPPQFQPSHGKCSSNNSKDSPSSSMQENGQEVVADPSWYGGPEAMAEIVVGAVASSDNIIKDSFSRELHHKEDQLRHIHTNTSTVDDDDDEEPTITTTAAAAAAAAASTPKSSSSLSPVKKEVASVGSDQEFKSFKNSVENNYMRLLVKADAKKQGREGSLISVPQATSRGDCCSERGKEEQTPAAAIVPPSSSSPPSEKKQEQLVQQPPPSTQSISNSRQASTPLPASADPAAVPSNTAPSVKTMKTELQEQQQQQQLQLPRPQQDEDRGSSQPPPPHRRSRIESKLITEHDDDGIEAVAVEDDIWDDVQAISDDDADQNQRSPVSTIMSPISTMSCSEDEAATSTWTEEEEVGDETNETGGDDEGHGSAAKEKSRRPKKLARRKKHNDEIQRKRRQVAMKTREGGWEGWGLHDEQKLASNVISWDSDSYNKPVRVSPQRKKAKRSIVKIAPARVEPPVAPKQDGWFTFNALMTTRSLEAAESELDLTHAAVSRRNQRREGRRSKRRGNGALTDEDFFSDTDSDNRPEQDLPLLIKRLTNQRFQKTIRMISREFTLSMSPDDQDIVAHLDSDISSEYDATGDDEEEHSTFASHTDSDHQATNSESGSRDSFFANEKKEMEDVDLVNSLAKRKPSRKRSDYISALGMNDYACDSSREEIPSRSGVSDA